MTKKKSTTRKSTRRKQPAGKKPVNNLIVISDLHCGCRVGLCPSIPIPLDDGGTYIVSKLQLKVWHWWEEFWGEWVPKVTHGEPFAVCVNGDALDGVHHGSTTQVSHNLADQAKIAELILKPIVDLAEGRYYHIRGTEAHAGKSGAEEERLAKVLNAVPDKEGRFARYELRARVGKGHAHIAHHIGTTGVSHYESTAVTKEYIEHCVSAAKRGAAPPDVVARAHRHRHIEVRVRTAWGYGISFVTPAWQLKTPFAYRVPGGRVTEPQIGGSIIRQGDSDVFTRHQVWELDPPKEEIV